MPGRVVLLHGTSSSGKSTVARAIQRLSEEPWVRLGIDAFWNAIDERWMEHGPHAAEGFEWTEDAAIVPGLVGQRLAAGMRVAVAACARAGNDLLVDDVFVDPAWLDAWRHELPASNGRSSESWHRSRCASNAKGLEATASLVRRGLRSM